MICCSSLPSGFPVSRFSILWRCAKAAPMNATNTIRVRIGPPRFDGILYTPWYSEGMRFEFVTAQRILFGEGVVREVPAAARAFGSRAILVRGSSPERTAGLRGSLEAAGVV